MICVFPFLLSPKEVLGMKTRPWKGATKQSNEATSNELREKISKGKKLENLLKIRRIDYSRVFSLSSDIKIVTTKPIHKASLLSSVFHCYAIYIAHYCWLAR